MYWTILVLQGLYLIPKSLAPCMELWSWKKMWVQCKHKLLSRCESSKCVTLSELFIEQQSGDNHDWHMVTCLLAAFPCAQSLKLVSSEQALKELGLNEHQLRFTCRVQLQDPHSDSDTLHRIYKHLKRWESNCRNREVTCPPAANNCLVFLHHPLSPPPSILEQSFLLLF